jgi:hypothetical protein
MRYSAPAVASVQRSPSRFPPVTTMLLAMPDWYRSRAWCSRRSSTGDGRQSYWAAPITTMASAGRASSRRLASHTWMKVISR